jgi:hypothetical protein
MTIRCWWYSYTRWLDRRFLWPACVDNADTLDQAKAAFALHASLDPAWTALGYGEMMQQIDELS